MNNLPGSTNIPLDTLLADPKFDVNLNNSQMRGLTHLFSPAVEDLWTATPQQMAVYHLRQVAKGERV